MARYYNSYHESITEHSSTLDQKDPLRHHAQTLLKLSKDIHEFREYSKLMDPKPLTRSTNTLTRSTKDLQNFLQGLTEIPLRNFVHIMLRLNKDKTLLYSYIHTGDVYGAILVGIIIGRGGLAKIDASFKGISMHTGLSAYLEMYVNLLAKLSKLEAIIYGRQKALEILLLRYDWITEQNDLESQWTHTKYHSALAHNYILVGQFNNFLEHWKKVLQLKWPLAQCKQVGCTSMHLALAHFGQGDYEQSAEQMETLLHSKSLRGNRRVRLHVYTAS